jgi:hypothetical protein
MHNQQPLNYRLLAISHSSSKDSILSFMALQNFSLKALQNAKP